MNVLATIMYWQSWSIIWSFGLRYLHVIVVTTGEKLTHLNWWKLNHMRIFLMFSIKKEHHDLNWGTHIYQKISKTRRITIEDCQVTWQSKPTKLDPYKRHIQENMASVAPIHLSAVVFMFEIKKQGYQDWLTQLSSYLIMLRNTINPSQARHYFAKYLAIMRLFKITYTLL